VSSGTVYCQERVGARCHWLAELVEEGRHDADGDDRQGEAEPSTAPGTGRIEQVDGGMALVLDAGRAGAALVPFPAVAAGLADPGSVSQPDVEAPGLRWATLVSAIKPQSSS
jgi:hypothetical protein